MRSGRWLLLGYSWQPGSGGHVWVSGRIVAEVTMSEEVPATPPGSSTSPEPPQPGSLASPSGPPPVAESPDQTTINIADEFGTAKRNLPPARIVGIGLVLVLIVGGIVILTQSRPTSHGSIDDVTPVEIAGQAATMVSINVTIQNGGQKPLWINSI